MATMTFPLMFDYDDTILQVSNSSVTGREFNHVRTIMRDRGLMNPTVRDPEYGVSATTTINLTGVDNQELSAPFDKPKDIPYSDSQIRNMFDGIVEGRDITQKDILAADNEISLDPRLQFPLERIAMASGSNMYGQLSQDFIKNIQQSNASWWQEHNLYNLPPGHSEMDELLKSGIVSQLISSGTETKKDVSAESERRQLQDDTAETLADIEEDKKVARDMSASLQGKSLSDIIATAQSANVSVNTLRLILIATGHPQLASAAESIANAIQRGVSIPQIIQEAEQHPNDSAIGQLIDRILPIVAGGT